MNKKKVKIYKKPNQMQQPMFNMGGNLYSESDLIKMYPQQYQAYQMAYGGNIPQHGFGEWLGKNAGTIGAVAGGVGGFFVAGPAGAAAGAKLGSMAGGKIQEKYEAKQAAELEAQQQAELEAQQNAVSTDEACNCEEPRREATATSTFAMGGRLKCMKCGGKTHYPDGGKITKRQQKQIDAGKKGRYLKEGPLTPEQSDVLDYKYPYSQSDIPIVAIPDPQQMENLYGDNWTLNELGTDAFWRYEVARQNQERKRKEEKIRSKRNFADGGAIQSPQYEAEGGEVIQADGMQIHGGGGNPNLSYRADGGAMINGVNHKEDSADPNSGVKLSSSGSTDGRIFSKRLKNPATKKPFATEADALLKKVGRYEKIIKDNKSEAIARKTAQIMADKYNAQLDELFEAQENLKKENNIDGFSLGTDEAVGAAKADAMGALPEGTPTQATLDIMKQQMAGIPAEQAMPELPMNAYGGYAGSGGSYRNSLIDMYSNPDMPRANNNGEILTKKGIDEGPKMPTSSENDIAGLKQFLTSPEGQQMAMKMLGMAVGVPVARNGGRLPQHGNGDPLMSETSQKVGLFTGAASSIPTTIFDLVQGSKDPYKWQQLQNAQQANALGMYDQAKGGLGTMGDIAAGMDVQAIKDFQASRDLYGQMGDLDISQQRADIKSGTGNQLGMLRGGAGSRQELLAGGQNIYNQQTAQLGQAEAYKDKYDLETQKLKAAGLAGLGSAEASLQAQKAGLFGQQAGMYGQLGGLYNQLGQQEREYLQYLNELDKQEKDLRTSQKRSGMAGIGNFLGDLGSAFIGKGISSANS